MSFFKNIKHKRKFQGCSQQCQSKQSVTPLTKKEYRCHQQEMWLEDQGHTCLLCMQSKQLRGSQSHMFTGFTHVKAGVPNLGYIRLSEGVHLKLTIEDKNTFYI